MLWCMRIFTFMDSLRAFSAETARSSEKAYIPKTYLTRKGAICLFSAPDDVSAVALSDLDHKHLRKVSKTF